MCKLLIVDDDKTILQLFSIALGREGYQVTTAESGREGLRIASEIPMEIILLDINLPDMSGIEVMRQVAKTTHAIVILITGEEEGHTHESLVQQGAADFIVKPVRVPELVSRLKQARTIRATIEAKEQLIADLERMAIRDELTGLYNFRYFRRELKNEVQRALRYQRPLSLVIADVDHFKAINDSLGHVEGDRVLAGIGRHIGATIRGADTGFRYGGEEFAILLPETHADQALSVAERVRQSIEDSTAANGKAVTVSAGVSEIRGTDDCDTLLRRTDAAMYEAKRAGRNRVFQA